MGTVFQEIRPDAGFKTGDFVEEKLGGAAVATLGAGCRKLKRGTKL